MQQSDHNPKQARSFSTRIGGAIGLLFALALLLAAPAAASYEQVGTFADEVGPGPFGSLGNFQLSASNGMAVNTSGAGGVPAGTIYALGSEEFSARVIVYGAKGEFRAEWGWGVAEDSPGEPPKDEFQRCGPAGAPGHPTCRSHEGGSDAEKGIPGEGAGQFSKPGGIAVDQTTGNVYVFSAGRQHGAVQIFSADGSQLIASFGEDVPLPEAEPISQSPEKFHMDLGNSNRIAVDDSGGLYVIDRDSLNIDPKADIRVMVFEPQSPGDYEHYVYAGRTADFAAEHDTSLQTYDIAVDSSRNLYVDDGSYIHEFSPAEPHIPTCEYHIPGGQARGIAVNPKTGEVFYSSTKLYQLTACGPHGEFEEKSSFAIKPKSHGGVTSFAFNPDLAYEASRPPGILYAADDIGRGEPGRGLIFSPAEIRPPQVESESVSSVGTSNAVLGAQINPQGAQTRYAFQYLTEAEFDANPPAERFAGSLESPLGGALLGTGQSPLSAGTAISGLEPDTAYRYRVLAASPCNPEDEGALCEGVGPAQAFRTFPSEAPGLPDNRAWELVSPPHKDGGEVFPIYPSAGSCGTQCKPGTLSQKFPKQNSPDGDSVVYEGSPFSATGAATQDNEYLARRTVSGWQTTNLSPELLMSGFGYLAFDANLTRGLLSQGSTTLSPEAPSEYPNLYTQPTTTPAALSPLLQAEPPDRLPGELSLTYAGASADFSHLLFEANDALSEETPFAPEAVDPGRQANNLYESVNGALRLVNVLPGNTEVVPGAFGSGPAVDPSDFQADLSHAVSADGSRVFWSDQAGQAYVRENGQFTRTISTEGVPDPGRFLTASADGSKVLLANGHLHDLGDEEPMVDLTEGKGGFQGILGQSEDLSSLYFVDTAVLDETPNEQGVIAQAGKDNLYAWHEGASAFVATLVSRDNEVTSYPFSGDWLASPTQRRAEASPDGRWLAFISQAPLTGYDNTGPCEPDGGLRPCFEAFLYDSATGQLTCPSCNPANQRPLGGSDLPLIEPSPSSRGAGSLSQPSYLTDSGRLYFDSQDSLTPFDTNNGVEDVYQYEPEAVGSCEREGGCVSLISAGHEAVDSNFFAADPSGNNVFFTSRDQLTLKDKDDLVDLYDAREGGGIASETEVARSECQGEACQPAISPPNDPTPGSSSFEGAGNVDEKKPAKKHKKKHKHAKKHSHKGSHGRAANHNRGGAK